MQIINGLISADRIVIILPCRILEERTMSLKDGIQNFKAQNKETHDNLKILSVYSKGRKR